MQQDLHKEVLEQIRKIKEQHTKQLQVLTDERDRLLADYKQALQNQGEEEHA